MQYVSRQVGGDGKSWSGKSAATRTNPARTSLEIFQLFNVGWHQNHAESRSAGRFWIMERLFLIEFNIREVIETLVLKNVAKRASQRVKRTSGARVMIIVGRSVYDTGYW